MVSGLLDQLEVELVTQEIALQALEHHVLHHRHVVLVRVGLKKTTNKQR
jgi:hypothetical protein